MPMHGAGWKTKKKKRHVEFQNTWKSQHLLVKLWKAPLRPSGANQNSAGSWASGPSSAAVSLVRICLVTLCLKPPQCEAFPFALMSPYVDSDQNMHVEQLIFCRMREISIHFPLSSPRAPLWCCEVWLTCFHVFPLFSTAVTYLLDSLERFR